MLIYIKDTGVVIHKVIAMNIINKTIAIIIDAITGSLPSVHPNIGRKIWVLEINPGIQHRNINILAAGVTGTPGGSSVAAELVWRRC